LKALGEQLGKEVVMTVAEIIKKTMLAGLGAQEKAKDFIDELIKAGELSKNEGSALIKEWISKTEQSTKDMDFKIKDAIALAYERLNISNRGDIEKLEKQIQALSARIAKLEKEGGQIGS
jgi:polyhydroxyalkanoate synthesis regulator phasin